VTPFLFSSWKSNDCLLICGLIVFFAPNIIPYECALSISFSSFLTYLSLSSGQPALSSVQFHLPALQSWHWKKKEEKEKILFSSFQYMQAQYYYHQTVYNIKCS